LVDDVCAYGFDTFLRNGSGNQLRDKRDYMISRLIEKYYSKTIRILEANQDYVDAIAEALLEKKVLLRVDFDKIKEKFIVNNQMIEKML
jgi:ATP-dependent Zn protease